MDADPRCWTSFGFFEVLFFCREVLVIFCFLFFLLHFALHHPGVAGRPVYIFGVGELDVEVMCKDEIISFLTIPPKASHEYILEKVWIAKY